MFCYTFNLGWCIIEWDGEDAYDPVPCKDIFPADELPMTSITFCPGEIVSALCQGKRYKGRIAAFAGKNYKLIKIVH